MAGEGREGLAVQAGPSRRSPPDPAARLCETLAAYMEPERVEQVRRACAFAARAHAGQRRLSGEPYVHHPLAVAQILAGMRMDHQSIMAAVLHDVLEDTPVTKEELERAFGREVAELVDGVSKLTQIRFSSRAEAQAENFRKMMLAMVRDIRVILVKLADRLHNMRTLGALPPERRRRIARETLEIYVPVANRLGMNTFRLELEDLGFAALHPMRYRVLAEAVRRARGNRKEIVAKIQAVLQERLRAEGLPGRVLGREKHLYSIYRKMRQKGLSFSEVFDVYAFRIVVDKVDTCYRALGAVHNLYKPVPGRFKDYIAIPKSNGYQSLHTVLFGPYGVPIEVQIRTEEMDKVAEAGIAAHWLYKAGEGGEARAQARAREWLRSLLEMQKSAGDSLEFLEHVKIDLFPDEVYVFTPKGEIMKLPRGATCVDFAYAVHTDVGNRCVAAKIDRRLAPLRTTLANGQTVEIITSPNGRPNPAWLNFVVTGKARANIRHYLKNLRREEAVDLGRRLLDKALAAYGLSLERIPATRVELLARSLQLGSAQRLFEEIGLGNRVAALVARRLVEEREGRRGAGGGPGAGRGGQRGLKKALVRYVPAWLRGPARGAAPRPLAIRGTEGLVVHFAKCCWPIPGDPIVGLVTAGRGIVIHTEGCRNLAEFRNRPERWIDVAWESEVQGEFPVEIRVDVVNRRGALATVAAAIAECDANIDNVALEERDGRYSTLRFVVEVHSRRHLARIMRRIRSIDLVARIGRSRG
ncbi:MAG: bifunctional (p)ppGpp synthetase/guanosine-3',5'-bis(diphosphate) 3'-pyrophosphohydrolase [Gammaproteobacteria bacterium]|nr:MAG: bifunctional (p)ppGpp synthetase/guanosine-3',5'-bis(diphosphate) 3'-pyrophosphohydrolase [Gammaproteobacteria bacterium]